MQARNIDPTYHLVSGFEAGVGDLGNGELLVVSLLRRNDRGVSRQREVNTRIRNQIRLKLGQIHIQRTVKPKRGCEEIIKSG